MIGAVADSSSRTGKASSRTGKASSTLVLYHNKNCSNSRGALAWLQENGKTFETIEYLREPPDEKTLTALVARLEDDPADLVRHDKRFKELDLDPDDYQDAEAVVALLVEHPELMQRPVVDDGKRAIIGRPPAERLPAYFA
jgi:arsenate reductase